MGFLKQYGKWIAVAVLSVFAVALLVVALTGMTPGKGKDDDKDKNNSSVEQNDKNDKDDKDDKEEVKKPVTNMIEEDGVEASEIGLIFGNTKYEGGLEDFGYTGEGVTIYEAIRSDATNVFFATDGHKSDTIKPGTDLLWTWEGDGGVFVNGYRENVPLVKYSTQAYYVYLAFDGNATVKPVKGMKVSIQGVLTDGKGGKANFFPVTYEYKGDEVWEIVSRKAIKPQEKPAVHATVKITGPDPERNDKNLFFLTSDGCGITQTMSLLWAWTEGGIYVDGSQVNIPMVKYMGNAFYAYFGMDNFATVNPVKGTRVSIQGTLSDGKNTTKFEPATFEFDGKGNWKVVSRVAITPQEKPAVHATVQITGVDPEREDKNLFFQISDGCGITKTLTPLWAWNEGGIYVNNVLVSVSMIKYAGNGYYVYFGMDNFATVNPVKGMRVSIQGTLSDGKNTTKFEPATFEFDGKGKWTLVSHEPIVPEEEKPGEVVQVTLEWDETRRDKNLFFTTDKPDAIKKTNTLISGWTEGGVYVNGKKSFTQFVKHSPQGYYAYFAFDGFGTINPEIGMKVSFQGILTDGLNSVEILPVTFEYVAENEWKVVSREAVVPEEEAAEIVKVTLEWDESRPDKNLFFKTDKKDAITKMNAPFSSWSEGGIYVNGKKAFTQFIKYSAQGYYAYFAFDNYNNINPVIGMKVSLQGILTDGENSVEILPVTFEYIAENTWKVVSRDPISEGGTDEEPDRPEPQPGEEEVYLYEKAESGTTLWFESSSNDTVSYSDQWTYRYWAQNGGGVYVNGIRKDIGLVKVLANTYLIYWPDFTITPEAGMKVTIQGLFSNGAETITFHSATFEYDGTAWKLVSREPFLEPTTTTFNVDETRTPETDIVWMSATGNNGIQPQGTGTTMPSDKWTEGGVYLNGQKVAVSLVKYSSSGYYVYLRGASITATEGTKVSIQGKYTWDTNVVVDFEPVTFTYTNGAWEVTSREPIGENEANDELVFSMDTSQAWTDNILLRASITNDIPNGDLIDGSKWTEGGVYLNGEKRTIHIAKHAATGYYIYLSHAGINPVEGMKVSVQGTYVHKGDITVKFAPVTFIFEGGAWKVQTREPLKEIMVAEVLGIPSGREKGNNLFFRTSVDDEFPINASGKIWWWDEGGVYLDGVKVGGSIPLMKYEAKGWYIYFDQDPNINPQDGSKVTIKGTLTSSDGSTKVKFDSGKFTFVFTDNGTTKQWYAVEEVTTSIVDLGQYMRFSVTPADSLPHDNGSTWNYAYWARYRGVYTKAPGGSVWTRADASIIKVSDTDYLLNGAQIAKVDGTQMKFGGIFQNETKASTGVMFDDMVFEWDADTSKWVPVS